MAKKQIVDDEDDDLESNALVVKGDQLPDFMREDAEAMSRLGSEIIKSGDMTIPRLALAQSMSPQLKESNEAKYIPELREGRFFNTLTKEIYGKHVFFTPLIVKKHRRKFGPREAGSPTECMSPNGETGGRISPQSCTMCPHSQFTYSEGKTNKPACTLFWEYIVVLHLPNRRFTPIALSMKSKALNAAKDLNAFIRQRGMASFTGVYRLEAVPDKGAGSDFYNLKVENAGVLASKQMYDDAKELFHALRDDIAAGRVKIDETSLNDPIDAEEVDGEEAPF